MLKSPFFHAHLHSQYSVLDGMTKVPDLVEKAARLGQPAIALADHGNMAGAVQLYQEAKKHGIKPYVGFEGYLIDPNRDDWDAPAKGSPVERYHFVLLAIDEEGYKALVKFSSMTHTRPRFSRFPRCTLSDLAELGTEHGEHLVFLTGCFFGYVVQGLVSFGRDEATTRIRMLAQWFPNLFVELQNHNIAHTGDSDFVREEFIHDADIVEALFDIAQDLQLPVIATQDSHYLNQRDKKAHDLMKRMTYGGADDSFPGDYFHLASAEWMEEHYPPHIWEQALAGFEDLLDLHDLSITPLDTFTPDVPSVSAAPQREITRAATRRLGRYLQEKKLTRKRRVYEERLAYELDVIRQLKMASYFVIVKDYVEWCHDERICVEARGSANGSLVCFLLGITQIDPIRWDVGFERFLSTDRIKPPDIDMDIEDEDRKHLVRYLLEKYEAVQIGTWGRLGVSYDEREDKETGSVLVTWQSWKRRECLEWAERKMEDEGGRKGDAKSLGSALFAKKYGHIKDVRDLQDLSPSEYKALRQIATETDPFRSYGVHAGGILLSGEHIKIENYIPTMLVASSDTTVTQYDMDSVEAFGLLKMDVLGQATLRTMKIAASIIGLKDPTDFGWIEDDDPEACRILREGRTENGIFHFEGYTKARGGKEMGIRTTNDAVLASALYMPGAMESGQTEHFIRARRDVEYRRGVQYLHPIFEKHLKPTHGAYVFQNQVMSILRDLGMDIKSINIFLKVVKDSGSGARERNAERLAPLKAIFDELWKKHGIDPGERDHTWDALCGFGAYGFNKAHAAGYGVRSYRCAYLKAHYPLEFMTALLQTWAGRTKERVYITEARRIGIRLMPPDINVSGPTWTLDAHRKAIRKGLLSIPGIGDATANVIAEHQPFTSMEDVIRRVPKRAMTAGERWLNEGVFAGTVAKLNDVGALDSLLGQ